MQKASHSRFTMAIPLSWTTPDITLKELRHLRQILQEDYPTHSIAESLADAARSNARVMGRDRQEVKKRARQEPTMF